MLIALRILWNKYHAVFIGTFVLAPDSTLELHRAHALARFYQKKHSSKPRCEGKMRVVKDRPGLHGKVVFALGAVELLVGFNPRNIFAFAARAFNAIRPAEFGKNLAAFIIGIEQSLKIKECHG